MRFLHTADWHIGRKLYGYDLAKEQEHDFAQITKIALEKKVDAIVIAGDLYDRALPNEDSVNRLNKMIVELNLKLKKPILAISGNHDSAARLNTGREWFKATQYFLNTSIEEAMTPVEFSDTQFFLLPYFQIFQARNFFADESLTDLTVAMKKIIKKMKENFAANKKHVLVAHFFAAGSTKTDSETKIEVGGLNAVPLDLLTDFDYVALGHLHDVNALHDERIKYSGSLAKFSVSEAETTKGVWIVDTEPFHSDFVAIKPLNDIVLLQDRYEELISPSVYNEVDNEDFVAITLTDKAVIPNVMNNLREFYPKIISLSRENQIVDLPKNEDIVLELDPMRLLENFFEDMTGEKITEQQKKWASNSLERVIGGEEE
ncbi:exonuclease SbcCD subunit D [Liquorilactobacillus mali]|uniref:Nuclease SbcCD subunit D n=1 Tax=Liquorilactobacillus mali KCTC 3596 = DSM 20444 TaxID=1046596 RepID=J0UTA5_9LACO|nr:exonuclease SbcCD subunit D [Liquorilactobacillus mali]EJF00576.1 exonuclease SbcD [Liquorilactobacillus mali KCTC 3596 = DSM 20444]KRN10189.1 exonuclease SbcD [Liquorilactobacillus mali KCTC 3596 = DSM 20444]MDC7953061.1 exonuclease SbcCD subunit D [Liquorilactobacillus mali]QFQ74061.1 exonuclease SbcCD subunit D [Liquorilactobacillus mali]